MGKDQFVVKHGDVWAVKGANNNRATKVTSTQGEAIRIARNIARNQHSETCAPAKLYQGSGINR
jgi:hypothetical protein